jgi:hypothetical protein
MCESGLQRTFTHDRSMSVFDESRYCHPALAPDQRAPATCSTSESGQAVTSRY